MLIRYVAGGERVIDRTQNVDDWLMFLSELEDAHRHLSDLIDELATRGSIEEESFRIQLAHVFGHLNLAWNGREKPPVVGSADWLAKSRFPTDLEPI